MEDLLTDKQKLFGKNELAEVANNWGSYRREGC